MAKTAMELAFRDMITKERSKNVWKWPEGDVRRLITVALWNIKESRKEQFTIRNTKEESGDAS